MVLRISHINHPLRLFWDTPYIDGIKNIKAALQLERISRIAERGIVEQCSGTNLSNRCIQFVVGGSLLIPGVNIVIDVVMRLLNGANWYGNYFPSSELRVPSSLDEVIAEKARIDEILSQKILPHLLEFLETNGYPEASVKYKVENENLKFDIHLKDNADISINTPYPITPILTLFPMQRDGETTERGIFAELKRKVIFYHYGIEDEEFIQEFISSPCTPRLLEVNGVNSFKSWMESKIIPNILQLMRNIGLENPQFSYEANPMNGVDEFSVDIRLTCNSKEFLHFHEVINGYLYISLPLFVKRIIHEIILNKGSL